MRLIDADQLLSFIELDERVIAPVGHTAQDIVMMIQTAPTIEQTNTNVSLTLEELRQMDGEPVWCAFLMLDLEMWCIAKWDVQMGQIRLWTVDGTWYGTRAYGKTVLAYRRRPEEGTT